jgi:hypothetical protein
MNVKQPQPDTTIRRIRVSGRGPRLRIGDCRLGIRRRGTQAVRHRYAPNKPNHTICRGSDPAGHYMSKARSGERKTKPIGAAGSPATRGQGSGLRDTRYDSRDTRGSRREPRCGRRVKQSQFPAFLGWKWRCRQKTNPILLAEAPAGINARDIAATAEVWPASDSPESGNSEEERC